MAGEIGCLAPGAFGELIVLDEDPLADLRVLAGLERFRYVVQVGEMVAGLGRLRAVGSSRRDGAESAGADDEAHAILGGPLAWIRRPHGEVVLPGR